ncbi:MAG TPA: transposase [Geobacteraceae bacterium]|nr:transposase [Geobacteraceae bacterium]
MESSVNRYSATIYAYCLMTNHYHLLLETPEGNLPEIMRHINGAYTNYYNTKRKRAGHLFQGRYKAILIEADEYLMELSRYIHLNPVRCGLVDKPEAHPWSSYNDYIGARQTPCWLRTDMVRTYFGDSKRYRSPFVVLPRNRPHCGHQLSDCKKSGRRLRLLGSRGNDWVPPGFLNQM